MVLENGGNAVDAAEFEQMYDQSTLRVPFFASIKICRRPSKASALQPKDRHGAETDFDCYVVEAGEQDMREIPLASSLELLHMMCQNADSELPTNLSMLRKSEHYGLSVQYITQEVPADLRQVASRRQLSHASNRSGLP